MPPVVDFQNHHPVSSRNYRSVCKYILRNGHKHHHILYTVIINIYVFKTGLL